MSIRPPPRVASVANLLGVVRIAATPVIMALLLVGLPGTGVVACVVFTIAAATDFLDGRIARARGEVSPLGIFMDLVADKVLVAGVLVAMVAIELVPTWMAATILIREFVVQSVRQLAATEDVVISASRLGKAKTLTTLVGLAMLSLAAESLTGGGGAFGDALDVLREVGFWVLLAATGLTVVSGIEYVRGAWPILSGRHPNPGDPTAPT